MQNIEVVCGYDNLCSVRSARRELSAEEPSLWWMEERFRLVTAYKGVLGCDDGEHQAHETLDAIPLAGKHWEPSESVDVFTARTQCWLDVNFSHVQVEVDPETLGEREASSERLVRSFGQDLH